MYKVKKINNFDDKLIAIANLVEEDVFYLAKRYLNTNYIDALGGNNNYYVKTALEKINQHCLDKRSPLQFAQNKLLEHVLKTYIIELFYQFRGLKAEDQDERNEADGIFTARPDHLPDILFKDGSEVEFVFDCTGWSSKMDLIDLRGNKLNALIERSKTRNVYIMLVDVINKLITFIKISPYVKFTKVINCKYLGGKDACRLDISDFAKQDFNTYFSHTKKRAA